MTTTNKILLIYSFWGIFCTNFSLVFAQKTTPLQDFNLTLKAFPELIGKKISANDFDMSLYKDMEPNLAWRVIQGKNEYMTPGEHPIHPIGYYKINDKVMVLLYANGKKGSAISHFVDIHTYNPKTGKRLYDLTSIAAFGGKSGATCMAELSDDKKKITFYTVTAYTTNKIEMEINDKGTIKEPKKK